MVRSVKTSDRYSPSAALELGYKIKLYAFKFQFFLAELQRAKRASEAPWVRKIGNPSSRDNLVVTSAYEGPYVRTDSGGGAGASQNIPHGHP